MKINNYPYQGKQNLSINDRSLITNDIDGARPRKQFVIEKKGDGFYDTKKIEEMRQSRLKFGQYYAPNNRPRNGLFNKNFYEKKGQGIAYAKSTLGSYEPQSQRLQQQQQELNFDQLSKNKNIDKFFGIEQNQYQQAKKIPYQSWNPQASNMERNEKQVFLDKNIENFFGIENNKNLNNNYSSQIPKQQYQNQQQQQYNQQNQYDKKNYQLDKNKNNFFGIEQPKQRQQNQLNNNQLLDKNKNNFFGIEDTNQNTKTNQYSNNYQPFQQPKPTEIQRQQQLQQQQQYPYQQNTKSYSPQQLNNIYTPQAYQSYQQYSPSHLAKKKVVPTDNSNVSQKFVVFDKISNTSPDWYQKLKAPQKMNPGRSNVFSNVGNQTLNQNPSGYLANSSASPYGSNSNQYFR